MFKILPIFLLALLAGCGSSGGAPGLPASAAASAPTEPEAPEPVEESSSSAFLDDLPEILEGVLNPWTGDLDGMVERRTIRVLTVFSPMFYFLNGAEQRGIVYESASAFEQDVNKRFGLERFPLRVVILPIPRDRLLTALVEGRGDIAAANLTITPERREVVDFSEPVLRDVKEVVVTGPTAPRLESLDDLAGQELRMRRSSSYWESIELLNDSLISRQLEPVRLVEVDGYQEDEDILELVQAGSLPMAIVDNHKARFWAHFFDKITVRDDLSVHSTGDIAWAFRKNSPKLKEAVDAFVRKHGKGTLFGNVVYKRYLEDTRWIEDPLANTGSARLRDVAPLFRKYGEMYDLDWLLLAAQGYQESHLDPRKRSHAGAIGVMQIMPIAAEQIGIANIDNVENNIHAGAKYMRYIIDKYFDDEELEQTQRQLFALAAYNAGPSRMRKVRAEAARNGLDDDRWFDNVEVVMARRVGSEPIRYVGNITKYYVAYTALAEQELRLGEAAN